MPLAAGLTLLNGYSGEHPQRRIEAIAVAPYPVAGDIQLGGVWLSDAGHAVTVIDQAYDFGNGELTSRFQFKVDGCEAQVEVLTFCSRDEPSLVCQEMTIELAVDSDLTLKAVLDARHVDGRALRHLRDTPGEDKPCCDGAALWESAGALSTCGIAYVTELVGGDAQPVRPPLENRTLTTAYSFTAKAGQIYRLRQIASLIPSVSHHQPDFQAVRQIALARKRGFGDIRAANREAWAELWKARITLLGADHRWQALADAALFYLFSSTHVASPASTSIFGNGDMARLSLLLWTRDVGHRDFRSPGPEPPAAARCRESSRLSKPLSPQCRSQRTLARQTRASVSAGERTVGTRICSPAGLRVLA
jgi:trehalose/maltose hydrolase-like predicted phosphorylase